MKPQLTLEIIAPYLPYRLQIKSGDSILTMVSQMPNEYFSNGGYRSKEIAINVVSTRYGHKPLLRPLSQLTQPITVEGYNDGKEFVPVVELLKMKFPHNDYNSKYGLISVSDSGFPSAYYTYRAQFQLMLNLETSEYPKWIADQLIKWHFDLHGLIEQELAINIELKP